MTKMKIIIVLVFVTVISSICYGNEDVGEQSKQDIFSEFTRMLTIYNLIAEHQKGNISLTKDEVLALREEVLDKLREISIRISDMQKNPYYETAIHYLPEPALKLWNQFKDVPFYSLSNEEIIELVGVQSESACQYTLDWMGEFLYYSFWAMIYSAISIIGIPLAVLIFYIIPYVVALGLFDILFACILIG